MNSLNQKCRLCNNYLISQLDQPTTFKCHSCNVEFGIYQNHWFSQTYYFNNIDISCLVMHLDTEFTIIIFRDPAKSQILIKGTWPHTKAEDALNFAKRLLSLKVFY